MITYFKRWPYYHLKYVAFNTKISSALKKINKLWYSWSRFILNKLLHSNFEQDIIPWCLNGLFQMKSFHEQLMFIKAHLVIWFKSPVKLQLTMSNSNSFNLLSSWNISGQHTHFNVAPQLWESNPTLHADYQLCETAVIIN